MMVPTRHTPGTSYPSVACLAGNVHKGHRQASRLALDTAADAQASMLIAGASAKRKAIHFFMANTSSFASINVRALANSLDGIPLAGTSNQLYLSVESHGEIVTQAWHRFGGAASANVHVIEVFDPD